MTIDTLTIVGVGLIGGSIGLAAKRRGLARQVLGAGRNLSTLERARGLGAIDEAYTDYQAAVARAQVAVFCTPVDCIVEQVVTAAPGCAEGTLLTDAGSTKGAIVAGIEGRLPAGVAFVGSHPLAGSEKRGPEHADANLFQSRLTIVARTAHTPPAALEQTLAFWEALGSRVRVMEPEEHDRALALTSHLPHLLAAALAGVLPAELHGLTATGFRDTTRIAAGDPALWTAIFTHNRSPVLEALGRLEERLHHYRRALDEGDTAALTALLLQAKQVRDALGS
jgi:prephenate dehydrogenase